MGGAARHVRHGHSHLQGIGSCVCRGFVILRVCVCGCVLECVCMYAFTRVWWESTKGEGREHTHACHYDAVLVPPPTTAARTTRTGALRSALWRCAAARPTPSRFEGGEGMARGGERALSEPELGPNSQRMGWGEARGCQEGEPVGVLARGARGERGVVVAGMLGSSPVLQVAASQGKGGSRCQTADHLEPRCPPPG